MPKDKNTKTMTITFNTPEDHDFFVIKEFYKKYPIKYIASAPDAPGGKYLTAFFQGTMDSFKTLKDAKAQLSIKDIV